MKFNESFARNKWKHFVLSVLIIAVYWWAVAGTKTNFAVLLEGIPNMLDFASRMFPPDFSILDILWIRMAETIQMALLGTTFGAIIAFPLSFLAARNIVKNKFVNQTVKTFFDINRAVSEIVWALLFVAMVGLGSFPGVLALTVHVSGALGRYFSEAIENINPELMEAVTSTGANRIQVIFHAVIPEVEVLFLGYVFYYFENSMRSATVLGLVGAGGLGIELLTSIKLFKYQEVSAILIIMLLLILFFDRLSAFIRKKFITGK